MNKYQEAIKVIKSNYPPSNYSMLREALDLSIELLEKATPKKPSFDKSCEDAETTGIYNEDGSINECVCLCPNCHKHSIYDSEYGVRFNHCHECGQTLDWE